MSKAVNILEVLEKAQQSPASVSKRNKQASPIRKEQHERTGMH